MNRIRKQINKNSVITYSKVFNLELSYYTQMLYVYYIIYYYVHTLYKHMTFIFTTKCLDLII